MDLVYTLCLKIVDEERNSKKKVRTALQYQVENREKYAIFFVSLLKNIE